MKPFKKKQPRKITPTYLKNSGLYYLQRYVASSFQFERTMRRKIDRSCFVHKDQNKEECYGWLSDVKKEFQDLGYLNDEAYLAGVLNSLRFSKGLSKRMIIMKMRDKGFNETEVLETLNTLEESDNPEENTELNAAHIFARRKKLGPYHPTPERKTYEQQLATIARAGFSYDICKKIMSAETALNE